MFCTARGGSTPCFRRRRGRRPGHDCRVIYVVLPPATFPPPASVHPDANSRERQPRRRAFIERVRRKRHARDVYVCITFFFILERAPCCQLKSLDTGKSRGIPFRRGGTSQCVPHPLRWAPEASALEVSEGLYKTTRKSKGSSVVAVSHDATTITGLPDFFQNGAVIAMVELQLYDTKASGPPLLSPFPPLIFPAGRVVLSE